MLLSFVWTVALLTLIAEKKFGVRIIGSITMPLAVVCVILMQLLPSEVQAAGSRPAVHVAACSRHPRHAGLCDLRRELRAGHDVPHPG